MKKLRLDRDARLDTLSQVLPDIVDLMSDPFGNYLFQKLLEVCTTEQRLQVIQSLVNGTSSSPMSSSSTRKKKLGHAAKHTPLVRASLNIHGTRSVQKLVTECKTNEEVRRKLLAAGMFGGTGVCVVSPFCPPSQVVVRFLYSCSAFPLPISISIEVGFWASKLGR